MAEKTFSMIQRETPDGIEVKLIKSIRADEKTKTFHVKLQKILVPKDTELPENWPMALTYSGDWKLSLEE